MKTALASAGPAIFASAATVIAALLCLMIAKVNGTSGLGPIAAMGVACAALSSLTLLPALLTIFGRRAFWPFVPHTAGDRPRRRRRSPTGPRRSIVEGSGVGALVKVVLAASSLFLVLLAAGPAQLAPAAGSASGTIPSLIFGPLDRRVFTPYEVRRHQKEHAADATHGVWARVGERDRRLPEADRGRHRSSSCSSSAPASPPSPPT